MSLVWLWSCLSANGQGCAPVLLKDWCRGIWHWSFLAFVWGLFLVLRGRPLGELLPINVPWEQEFSGGPNSWSWVSCMVQALPLAVAPRLHRPHSTKDNNLRLMVKQPSTAKNTQWDANTYIEKRKDERKKNFKKDKNKSQKRGEQSSQQSNFSVKMDTKN